MVHLSLFYLRSVFPMDFTCTCSARALDEQRLAVAIFLARRDVLRFLSPPSDGQQYPSGMTGCRSHRRPNRTTYSTWTSWFRRHTAEPVVKSYSVHPPCLLRSSSSPPRDLSPPTHDPGPKPSSRQPRPLHVPTDKQLQSAKDSHFRQLRAKIDRYTSALAALRIQSGVMKSCAHYTSELVCPPPTSKKSLRVPRNQSLLPKRSVKSSGCPSSVLHHQAVPLRMKTSTRPRTSFRGASLRASTSVTEYSIDPNSKHTVEHNICKSHLDTVSNLWNEALTVLHSTRMENVVLKPDSSSHVRQLQVMNYLPSVSPSRSPVTVGGDATMSHTDRTGDPSTATNVVCRELTAASHSCVEADYLYGQLHKDQLEKEAVRRRWTHSSSGPLGKSDHDEIEAASDKSPLSRGVTPAHENGSSTPLQLEETPSQKPHSRAASPPSLTSTFSLRHNSIATISPISDTVIAEPLVLCLSTRLHHEILCEAAQRQNKVESSRMRMDGSDCTSTPTVSVCEDLAYDLLERLLNDVVAEIEWQTYRLIDQVVEGELNAEPPDSTSTCSSSPRGLDPQPAYTTTHFDNDVIKT